MAQTSGRLTCPRCGANNFETVTTCWKCSAPLNGAGHVNAASSASSASAASTFAGGYNAGAERAASAAAPAVFMTPPAASTGDSGVAIRAAIALALTFPWIGLPVGWCFMMIEDRRKQAIGRVCAVWSMGALVFHLLITFVLLQSAMSQILPILMGVAKAQGGGNGGAPNLNIPGGLGGGSQ